MISVSQRRIQRFSLQGGAHGERVERELITGVRGGLWAAPSAGSMGRAPCEGSGGRSPLKLKAFWLLNVPQSRKIYPVFVFFVYSIFGKGRAVVRNFIGV